MKKIVKILTVVMIVMMCISTVSTVFAGVDPSAYTGGEYDTATINKLGNQVIQIISTIGSIISVIVLIILGIKYMMGSTEEKADYKKTLLPYIIGAAIVFAAASIAGIIFGFANNLGK